MHLRFRAYRTGGGLPRQTPTRVREPHSIIGAALPLSGGGDDLRPLHDLTPAVNQ